MTSKISFDNVVLGGTYDFALAPRSAPPGPLTWRTGLVSYKGAAVLIALGTDGREIVIAMEQCQWRKSSGTITLAGAKAPAVTLPQPFAWATQIEGKYCLSMSQDFDGRRTELDADPFPLYSRMIPDLTVEAAALRAAITDHSRSTYVCEACGDHEPRMNDDVCTALFNSSDSDKTLRGLYCRGLFGYMATIAQDSAEYGKVAEFAEKVEQGDIQL